jgi:undecaprenyl-diphosphatase
MAGRQCGKPQAAKLDRLTIGHFEHTVVPTEAMSIQLSRGGRSQSDFVSRDMIRMGVGYERSRLATAHVDGQGRLRQKKPVVKVKHVLREIEVPRPGVKEIATNCEFALANTRVPHPILSQVNLCWRRPVFLSQRNLRSASMTLIEAIVLAVIQGLTEFIPISSTAHLRIAPALLGWSDPGAAFTAVIQIGTMTAVLVYFWRDIVRIATAMLADLRRGKLATTHDAWMGWMIGGGTIPIVVFGLLFKHAIKTTLRSLYVISTALAVVAVLLAIAEWAIRSRRAGGRSVDEVDWRDAIVVGFSQACALVPGTSRSGATILGGLCCGLSREAAARFSFLLSIPSVLAAGVYELVEARYELLASGGQVTNLVVATIVAGLVGYATIPWLLGYLRTRTMWVFIVYRLILAAVLVGLLQTGRLVDDKPTDAAAMNGGAAASTLAALATNQ